MPTFRVEDLPPPPAGTRGWPWTEGSPPLPPARPDGSPWPSISIVTPTFNQGRYIEETIRSILLQGYPNLEYLVIDAGSTDGAVDIIRKYEKYLTYWVSEPDRGQSDAINKGFARCTGALMNWINSDDILLAGALAAIADAALARPDCGAYCGASDRFDEGLGRTFYECWRTEEQINQPLDWINNYFLQPAAFFRREMWQEFAPLDLSLRYTMDVDFWIRASKKWHFAWVPKLLTRDRLHPAAKTTAELPQTLGEIAFLQARYGAFDVLKRDVAQARRELAAAEARCRELETKLAAQAPITSTVRQRCYGLAVWGYQRLPRPAQRFVSRVKAKLAPARNGN